MTRLASTTFVLQYFLSPESEFLWRTQVLVTHCGSSAILADEIWITHQFLIILKIRFNITDILEITQMFLVS